MPSVPVPPEAGIRRRDREARIRGDLLRSHSHEAKELRIIEEKHGATPTFMLVLDTGWAERPIACNMYGSDAEAIADALALVLCCPVVKP
jgi:hypothetical protein